VGSRWESRWERGGKTRWEVQQAESINERPHFGIGLKTPLEAIESVSKVLKH